MCGYVWLASMSSGSINADDTDNVSRRKLSKTGLILIGLSGEY
jgi:hypothetical protein